MTGNEMSTPVPWHLDPDLAGAYAARRTDPVLTASLEVHLLSCADCRGLIARVAPLPTLDTSWVEVLERVERPRPRLLERVLLAVGIESTTARLLALTPSLRGAWLGGVVLVLTIALVLAYADGDGVAFFLAVAPLLPAAGVAFAFGPASDPAHELTAAAPYSSLRLLAIRTALVVGTTLAPAAVVGALLPGRGLLAVAWLVPALALAAGTLAIGALTSPLTAAVGLAGSWLAVTTAAPHLSRTSQLVTEPGTQLTCLVLLLLFSGALVHRRNDLPELFRRIG